MPPTAANYTSRFQRTSLGHLDICHIWVAARQTVVPKKMKELKGTQATLFVHGQTAK